MYDDNRYLNHYGLIASPFRDLTDRRFIWLGEKQLEMLAHLKVGIEEAKGVLLLLGEEGSGKSVLLGCLFKIIRGDAAIAVLREPHIGIGQFLEFLADQYQIRKGVSSKGKFLIDFRAFLMQAQSSGKRALLVIEDAEKQDDEILEQIRLLSNMEETGEKLLSILLVGNGELGSRLLGHRHRALMQRVAVRCQVGPLTEKETAAYIRHRMMAAGSYLEIFTPESVRAIHLFSGGLPRMIDVMCDHALMRGYLEMQRTIGGKVIAGYAREVRRAIGLRGGIPGSAVWKMTTSKQARGSRFSSKLLPAAFVLTVFLLLAAGFLFIRIEDKPRAPTPPALPAPISLYFEAGSSKLPARDFSRLDEVAKFLVKNQQARVTVKGYSDPIGSVERNMRISAARAEGAKAYLVEKGVDPGRILAVGLGSQKPLAGGQSFEIQEAGRRVEIEVTSTQ